MIHSSGQALVIAVEMEKRAIRLYERALMLFGAGAAADGIRQMLREENGHLVRFQALLGKGTETPETDILLKAESAALLFRGGLTAAVREGAFESAESLLEYAKEQEALAIKTYLGFAERAEGDTRAAFLSIADEESRHLATLEEMTAEQAKGSCFGDTASIPARPV